MDAIRASFDFTKNNAGNVILWFLISPVAWFVGAACGVGDPAGRADRNGLHPRRSTTSRSRPSTRDAGPLRAAPA